MHHPADDLVVLVDDAGNRTGTAARATVHTTRTPLHALLSPWSVAQITQLAERGDPWQR